MFSLKTTFVAGEVKATDMPDRNIFNFPYKYHGLTKIFMTAILIKTGNQAKKQVIFTRHSLFWPMDNRRW
jgi:hypothetical protein